MSDTTTEQKQSRIARLAFVTYVDRGQDYAGNATAVVRTAQRDEEISVLPEEEARLDSLGALYPKDASAGSDENERRANLARYRAERGDAAAVAEAVARAVSPVDAQDSPTFPHPNVSAPGLGTPPVGGYTEGDTGGPDTQPPAGIAPPPGGVVRADAPEVSADNVGAVAAWISEESPNVDDTVALAEGDPERARVVLEAESQALGGDPRKTVQDRLGKIIDAE